MLLTYCYSFKNYQTKLINWSDFYPAAIENHSQFLKVQGDKIMLTYNLDSPQTALTSQTIEISLSQKIDLVILLGSAHTSIHELIV